MAPKGISTLIDSDMQDSSQFNNEDTIESIETNDRSPEPPKKKGGRPKGSKTRETKAKTAPRKPRTASSTTTKSKGPSKAGGKRKPPSEQTNAQSVSLTAQPSPTTINEDHAPVATNDESEDELDSPKTIAQDVARGKNVQNEKRGVGAQKKRKHAAQDDRTEDGFPSAVQGNPSEPGGNARSEATDMPATKKARTRPMVTKKQPINQERQQISMNAEERGEETATSQRRIMSPASRAIERPRALSRSRQEPQYWRRPGSASDTERAGGDPNLRRKLGDITKKFENVDLKYRNLKEIGIAEANANVEKLRTQCEATTQASNELVTALKKELAAQSALAQESRKLQRSLSAREIEVNTLRSNVTDLTASLSTAQNEIRALQAKLTASRTASSSVEPGNSKTPGSIMKHQAQSRPAIGGNKEASQVAQLKEDLYSDLTGLIIRSVKKVDEGDLYDCIQTGRNGTLHFKLLVEDPDGQSTSFEETEFLYIPLVDPNRDRDLLEVLPDYLTDEITFNRLHASKFYSRVVDALTKQKVREEA